MWGGTTTLPAVRRAVVHIVIALAAVTLAACGTDGPPSGAAPATTTAEPAAPATTAEPATTGTPAVAPRSARDGCKAVAAPMPSADPTARRPRRRLNPNRTHTAVMRTNCGTISIRLSVRRSPKTTASFASLARQRFYDRLSFHRIAKPGGNDYVIQGGDPLLNGNGGPGYTVVEAPSKRTSYRRYVAAMAKTQTERRGTSGSQFFIVTARDVPLDPDYAVLGRVTGGTSVVRRIARLATDPATEAPIDPVVIRSVRIRSSG